MGSSLNMNCPVCKKPLTKAPANAGEVVKFDCPYCGKFVFSDSLLSSLDSYLERDQEAQAKLSHAIRRAQEGNELPRFDTITVEEILKHALPRPREQADLLIRWLAANCPAPGDLVSLDADKHGAIIGIKTPAGFGLVVNHLFEIGLLTGHLLKAANMSGGALATLSFSGWDYYEQLRDGRGKYKKAFMAMQFKDSVLDHILETVFKPSVRQAGFTLFKLDDVPRAGLIDDRLRVEIQSSDFVIADLTHANLGAYWEAGYAEGLGKPVIYTCEKKKFEEAKTHFDTNHHLTIVWDEDDPKKSGIALKATIRATLPHLAKQTDD